MLSMLTSSEIDNNDQFLEMGNKYHTKSPEAKQWQKDMPWWSNLKEQRKNYEEENN